MTDKSIENFELSEQEEKKKNNALLISRTKRAAFYALLFTCVFVFLMGPAEDILALEVYPQIKAIAGVAALLNLIVFLVNIWIISKKRKSVTPKTKV